MRVALLVVVAAGASCVFPESIGEPCTSNASPCSTGQGCYPVDPDDPRSDGVCLPPRDLEITSCTKDDDCLTHGYPVGAVCNEGTCECDAFSIHCDSEVDPISCLCPDG
jgi:hypothetical protein